MLKSMTGFGRAENNVGDKTFLVDIKSLNGKQFELQLRLPSILKPFEFDRFLKAVYKAKEYMEFLSSQDLQMSSIFIKANYEMMKINLKDIDLIEALDDYIKLYIKPTPILTLMTLKSIQEKLPTKEFIRIHRSYIIPLSKVEKFSKSKVFVSGKELPIGTSYNDVYEVLLQRVKTD